MPRRPSPSLGRCAALGVAGGMRTFVPVGVVALRGRGPAQARRPVLVLAAGELVADKLPQMSSRLEPPALAARALGSGAAAGALGGGPFGAALAALAALASAPACFHARRALGRMTGRPDALWALAEDALALSIAAAVTRP